MNGSGSIGGAADFVTSLLTGSLAMGLATLAVAGVGFAMLTGRLELRRGAAVILGCFVMLGAPALARGIVGLGGEAGPPPPPPVAAAPSPPATLPLEAKEIQKSADPYAGASLIR
jgi:type IV secretory pathway VirB2 component (pilin)